MTDIHASCVLVQNRGILITGASGSGKSDLCLRLIIDHQAHLVADDRVDLLVSRETLYASPPPNLQGLLEIRGSGIHRLPFRAKAPVDLVVSLEKDPLQIERLPEKQYFTFSGIRIPRLSLCSFTASAPARIIAALRFPLLED